MINMGRLLKDRGHEVKTTFFEKDDPLEAAGALYTIAKNKNCSLGEAMRVTVPTKDSDICLWLLDRNYDASKQRDRMISTEQVKYLCDVMNSDDHNIVISPNKLSPQARKEMPKWAELFLFDDLLIDLPRHILSVKHSVVTLQQARAVLGQTLSASDLPLLLQSDPMVRWHNWPVGSIVFLKNPVMNTFRVVV